MEDGSGEPTSPGGGCLRAPGPQVIAYVSSCARAGFIPSLSVTQPALCFLCISCQPTSPLEVSDHFPQSSFGADVGDKDCEPELMCPTAAGMSTEQSTQRLLSRLYRSDRLAWVKPCGSSSTGSFLPDHLELGICLAGRWQFPCSVHIPLHSLARCPGPLAVFHR